MILVQARHGDSLSVSSQLPSHITVCRESRVRIHCRPIAVAWCENDAVSRAAQPATPSESDPDKESGAVIAPQDVSGSPSADRGAPPAAKAPTHPVAGRAARLSGERRVLRSWPTIPNDGAVGTRLGRHKQWPTFGTRP